MNTTMIFENLSTADVENRELNPLAYDRADYPLLTDMLQSRQFNSNEVYSIDLTKLSKKGILIQDPMQVYLDKRALSSSALKEAIKTPAHYSFYQTQKHSAPAKDHFDLGTFAHMAFIEPEQFHTVIIEPKGSLGKKDDVLKLIKFYCKLNKVKPKEFNPEQDKLADMKTYLAEQKDACHYQVVSREHQDIIDAIKYNYNHYGSGIIPRILKGAMGETSFYSKDADTGMPVKIRCDCFNVEENIGVNAIISFKTTSASTLSKFIYDSAKYQYELSEGMYQIVASEVTGRKFNVTIMIMLQTVPPYLPAVFWWTPDDLQNGKYKYRNAMSIVAECESRRLFPGFDAMSESGNYGIIELFQPEWSKKELPPVDIED
jgi:hypothetical protein